MGELARSGADDNHLWGVTLYPVFSSLLRLRENVVGFLIMSVALDTFFDNLLPEKADNILVMVNNTCGQSIGYEVVNGKVGFGTWR